MAALNELPSDHSPMGSRDTKLVLNLTASWDSPDEDNVHIGWARDAWNDMRQFSTGGTYVNFLNDDDGEDRQDLHRPAGQREADGERGQKERERSAADSSAGSTRP